MTERDSEHLEQSPDRLMIGPSSLDWSDGTLQIAFDEVCAPVPQRLRGTITLKTDHIFNRAVHLDSAGDHRWWPISPVCQVKVKLDQPDLSWSGDGYFDSNDGDVPLEDSFSRWNWSRAALPDGAAILYDVVEKDGNERGVALRFTDKGVVNDFNAPAQMSDLPRTKWLLQRQTRSETEAGIKETVVDAPFYSRSVIRSQLLGLPVTAMHESLDMDRFVNPATQFMLPFKAPRRFW